MFAEDADLEKLTGVSARSKAAMMRALDELGVLYHVNRRGRLVVHQDEVRRVLVRGGASRAPASPERAAAPDFSAL